MFGFTDHANSTQSFAEIKWFKSKFSVDFGLWCSSNSTCKCKSMTVFRIFILLKKFGLLGYYEEYRIDQKRSNKRFIIKECLGSTCLSFWIPPMPLLVCFQSFSFICCKKLVRFSTGAICMIKLRHQSSTFRCVGIKAPPWIWSCIAIN